jgi:hypothetical protein
MWREQRPEENLAGDWQFQVEHIQSGKGQQFGTFDELVLYLQQMVDKPEKPSSPMVE